MMNSIQSYVHGPHSIASNEETFVCSNSEAFTSELIENPEYISVICLACSTYQPHDIVLTGAKGLRPGIKYFSSIFTQIRSNNNNNKRIQSIVTY